MSIQRSIARNIARNRLIDAGYERPNKRMAMSAGGKRGYIKTVISQRKGLKNSRMARAFEEKLRESDPPIWRRVLCGDLSKEFAENSAHVWFKRGLYTQAKRVHRNTARNRQGKKQLPKGLDCSGVIGGAVE